MTRANLSSAGEKSTMDQVFTYGTRQQLVILVTDIDEDCKPKGMRARDWERIKSAYLKKVHGKPAKTKPVALCSTKIPVVCGKAVYLTGKCRECYSRHYYMHQAIKVIAAFAGEADLSKLLRSPTDSWISSGNPLMYSFRTRCAALKCREICALTHPLCAGCTSQQFGLGVIASMIPGAGLGLVATRDFEVGQCVGSRYGKKTMSRWEKDHIEASTNAIEQARAAYLMELSKDTFIDGFGEDAGIVRFINNAPSNSLVNCKFKVDRKAQTVSVETTKQVLAGCEFLLVYSYTANGCGVCWNKTNSESKARLLQRQQIVAAMKHTDG
jgi:hypothetical protein